jgi:preprotein translocase subunit SecG
MYTFIIVIHIFASMVLILVILMQAGRGGGVSEIFSGSSTQTIFGTSASNFLMKATAVCAVLFILTSISLAVLSSGRSRSLMESQRARSVGLKETKGGAQEKSEGASQKAANDNSQGKLKDVSQGEKAKDVSKEGVMPTENEKKPIESKSESKSE